MDDETSESPDQPDEPETPAPTTSLVLTDVQLRRLVDYARTRLDSVCKEMGRGKDGLTEAGSWLDKRRLNQLWYEGDLAWRAGETYLGGVFDDSNFTRGDGKRYVNHLAAKVADDMLGTEPFFASLRKDRSTTNPAVLKAVEEVAQEGVDDSNLPDTLREAVTLALVRNEAVVKLRNVFEATGYMGPAEVLVDANGAPVLTPEKQLYIFRNDDLLPIPDQPGVVALTKDASFMVAEQDAQAFQYAQFDNLPQTQVKRDGLDGRVIDPRDFICPLKVDSIHEADIVAHFYDETPTVLSQLYGQTAIGLGYYSQTESGTKSAIASQGEQRGTSMDEQWVPVGEVYVRYDANEDGQEEDILLVLDRSCDKALFCDYLNNHMKKRPFEVLHGLRKVPGRWYGVGVYTDKFDQLIFVDKTFNRINLKNSKSCTVTAVRRDAVQEWSASRGAPIRLGGDEVLTLDSKWGDEKGEFIRQVRLIEISTEEESLMQTMLQAMDQEFGYISAADASATGLNQSKTATGIASIERSGNNIVKAVERIHARGIENVLEQAVDIILENVDPTRIALTNESAVLTLSRDEIRDLPRDVKLLLTRSRSSETLQTNQQAIVISNQYFDVLEANPRRAKSLRPIYISSLKALDVDDADERLPEVTDEMITAWQAQQQSKSEPPKESVSIALKDLGPLTPEERAQALGQFNIKASPPQAVQQALTEDTLRVASAKRLQNPPDQEEPPAGSVVPMRPQPNAPAPMEAAS